jgi:hypothetical protein
VRTGNRPIERNFGVRTLTKAVLALAVGMSCWLWVNPASSSATAPRATTSAPLLPPGASVMAGKEWLIKSNDLAVLGGMGSYEWVGCGLTTAPLTPGNYSPCQPGQVPIYTSYSTFKADVLSHKLVSGDTVIFDNEVWKYTPTWEQRDQALYEQLAAQLAASNGITFINTPYAKTSAGMFADDVAAAKYASVVEIQAQTRDRNPAQYLSFVEEAVTSIRLVNPSIPILAGLATDAGGIPTTTANMLKEYNEVKNFVQGFWLNVNTWAPPHAKGCALKGCPQVARQFLEDIGVPPPAS